MDLAFLQDKYVIAIGSGVLGVIVTLASTHLLNKRGLFTYFVRHNRIAVAADDAVFGSVRVTWNDTPMNNVFASSVELTNESLKDFENVVVRLYSDDTFLLTDRTEIVGTTHVVYWASDYAQAMVVPAGTVATQDQLDTYYKRRDYLVPTFNRGQVIRFALLNSMRGATGPTIWVDVLHKGTKVKFRVPHPELLGVPQPHAVAWGSLLGVVFVAWLVYLTNSVALAGWLSFVFGLLVILPGALAIHFWRWIRARVGD